MDPFRLGLLGWTSSFQSQMNSVSVAVGGGAIRTPLSILNISLVILLTQYTKRGLNDSTAHG